MPRSCCLLAVSPEGSRRSADLPVQESFWLRGDDVCDIKSWHWKEQNHKGSQSAWAVLCPHHSLYIANPTLSLLHKTPDLLQDGFSHALSPFSTPLPPQAHPRRAGDTPGCGQGDSRGVGSPKALS